MLAHIMKVKANSCVKESVIALVFTARGIEDCFANRRYRVSSLPSGCIVAEESFAMAIAKTRAFTFAGQDRVFRWVVS